MEDIIIEFTNDKDFSLLSELEKIYQSYIFELDNKENRKKIIKEMKTMMRKKQMFALVEMKNNNYNDYINDCTFYVKYRIVDVVPN